MQKLIAVVDDEEDIAELVSVNLERSGYKPKVFHEAKPFMSFIRKTLPDLIILDLMLPDMNGIELCKTLKMEPRFAGIPVIMLTAKVQESDRIVGLEIGADDYVTKPFSPGELVARVKAVLRRIETSKMSTGGKALISIDKDKHSVTVSGKAVDLTLTEFKILELLLSEKGKVFSRERILEYCWGNETVVMDRTVDVHMRNLREKLGAAGKIIKNIRGVGYKINE